MALRRLDSQPELLRRLGGAPAALPEGRGAGQRPAKVLLNVTVQGSLGPVQVVMPPESAVADLIKAAVEAYAREGRRPLLRESDPAAFELHYSQFSLESLSREEKVVNLGSRSFFLCRSETGAAARDCRADEAKKAPSKEKSLLPLSRFHINWRNT